MTRSAVLVAGLALLGTVTVCAAVTLEVTDGKSPCIKAELSAVFLITYNITNGTRPAVVPLPDSAKVGDASSCGGAGRLPTLVATFGAGHALGLEFTKDGDQYSIANLSLQYNVSDATTFPESNTTGLVIQSTNSSGIAAHMNTTYKCLSETTVSLGSWVTVTFSGVRMEAYMSTTELSPEESTCSADMNSTTPAPPTTTAAPTSPPIPGNPESGNYNVTVNGTTCLLARMGIQLNVTYFSKSLKKDVQGIVNVQPNLTTATGLCSKTSSTLHLQDNQTTLLFTFTLNTTSNKYHLSGVDLTALWQDMNGTVTVGNTSLDTLEGSLGRSYMCNAQQNVVVTSTFSINTVRLQVQPFGVNGDQFGTAEDCQVDQDNMLIPIIVGAALAGLVLIVLIAYLIGRKRSHAGYQSI
ncbi:lysosome-associated membrane glycoprotein 1a [Denticeps clupeoides]|uniref:Lysosome-associated membrane glycoprotein 1 n=1 Tax=Denticeps clupeoides TaxID=299321 RepID=A0AAY4EUD5_9TELE|nr:lysosome-associated membrane glycoprotein 1 [Denticeps clupeoides]